MTVPEQPATDLPPEGKSPRRASITAEELIHAALDILGPNRSISTLGLREIARQAGIAPNSFYRHFHDVDELAIALIERAGNQLRTVIGSARKQVLLPNAVRPGNVVETSMQVFINQLNAEEGYLKFLLREGRVGSEAFKAAIEQELAFFENELQTDLISLERQLGYDIYAPHLVAKAITRLTFEMGAVAADLDEAGQQQVLADTVSMIQMIISGARVMGVKKNP